MSRWDRWLEEAKQAVALAPGEIILEGWVAFHCIQGGSQTDYRGHLILTSQRIVFTGSKGFRGPQQLIPHLSQQLNGVTEVRVEDHWFGQPALVLSGHRFRFFRAHPETVRDVILHARTQYFQQPPPMPSQVASGMPPGPIPQSAPGQRPCPFCGNWNPPGFSFCGRCGKTMPEPLKDQISGGPPPRF